MKTLIKNLHRKYKEKFYINDLNTGANSIEGTGLIKKVNLHFNEAQSNKKIGDLNHIYLSIDWTM